MTKITNNNVTYRRGNNRMLDKYRLAPFHKSDVSWKFREFYLPPD